MRILIVSPIFFPEIGGPATYIANLTQLLSQQDHRVEIVTFCHTKPQPCGNTNIHWVPTNQSALSRQLRLAFKIIQTGKHFDLIYIQGPLVVGLTGTLIAKIIHKPVVIKYVGDEVWEEARNNGTTDQSLEDFLSVPHPVAIRLKLRLEALSFFLADKVITPSNYLKQIVVKNFGTGANKVEMIHNAIEAKEVAADKKPNQLIFVGRLVKWKNVDKIIAAVNLARARYPWKLIIVGTGPLLNDLRNLVKKFHAGNWVEFLGTMDQQSVHFRIKESKKLILYSQYEGLPHTLIEAMSLNIPVIASDIAPNRETIGQYGQLVGLNQIEALADAINQPVTKVNTREFATQTYSWKKHSDSLLQLFQRLIR